MKYKKLITTSLLSILTLLPLEASVNPEQFYFQDTIVKNKKNVESNLITIKGLEKEQTLKLHGAGIYMLNGVYMGRKESQVKEGDKIRLMHQSIEEDGAKISTVLIVGNTYDIFTTETQVEHKN